MTIKIITKTIYKNDEGFDFTFEPNEDSLKISKTKDGFKARYLTVGQNSETPREWDNNGIMVCFHNRYNLGDKTNLNSDSFDNWDELHDFLIKEYKAICVLPLYLYDHSGITISTTPFNCRWDSGQIGFIYTTKEQLKSMGHKKIPNEETLNKWLKGEIETYDQYLRGEVYTIVEETYNKEKESIDYNCVGGFFGYDETLKELESYEF